MSSVDFAQLFQLMQQNPDAGRQLMTETLRARAGDDPRMAMMLDYMKQSEAPASEPVRDPGRAQRIRATIQEMREELVELHQRNEDLADALGACPVCWGRVRHCEECRGRGRPGWQKPDPQLFDELVAPAITKRGEP
ncbi:MAG: hypothetical protein WKG01_13970 [Kofleriaceae bacterium]